VRGGQLINGVNTIKASYSGTTSGTPTFSPSSGTVNVSVTGTTPNSIIAVTITPNPVVKSVTTGAWPFSISLSNTGGPTTFNTFTVNGNSYSQDIAAWFGSSSLAPNGKLTTNLQISKVPVPTSIVFGFAGTDANGNTWSQTVTVPFQ
jgi:hypothetical protein